MLSSIYLVRSSFELAFYHLKLVTSVLILLIGLPPDVFLWGRCACFKGADMLRALCVRHALYTQDWIKCRTQTYRKNCKFNVIQLSYKNTDDIQSVLLGVLIMTHYTRWVLQITVTHIKETRWQHMYKYMTCSLQINLVRMKCKPGDEGVQRNLQVGDTSVVNLSKVSHMTIRRFLKEATIHFLPAKWGNTNKGNMQKKWM